MITTVTTDVTKRCPFKHELDTGRLILEFDGKAPELHALAVRIAAYADVEISHEDFTEILRIVSGASMVRSEWVTAELQVVVVCC